VRELQFHGSGDPRGLLDRGPTQLVESVVVARGIVVEHDEEAIRCADHLIDIGPGAGAHGGEIVASGTVTDIMAEPRSITGDYLAGRRRIALPSRRTPRDPKRQLVLRGAAVPVLDAQLGLF